MVDSSTIDIQFCKAEFIYNLFQGPSTKYVIFDTRHGSMENSLSTSICLERTIVNVDVSDLSKIGNANNENQSQSANANNFTTPQGEPEEKQDEKLQLFSRLSSNTKLSFTELEAMIPYDSKEKLKTLKRRYCVIILNDDKRLYDYFMEDKESNIDFARKNCFKKDSVYLQTAINKAYFQDSETHNREDLQSIRLGLELYELIRSQKVKTAYILIDGANQLFEKYPFLNCKAAIPKLNFKFPNEILNGRIYLGDQSQVLIIIIA